jgi:hypothetical protein
MQTTKEHISSSNRMRKIRRGTLSISCKNEGLIILIIVEIPWALINLK